MSIVKDFRYPVSVEWEGGRLTRARADEKPDLEVATPPEFRGGLTGYWSPEELLVAAAASCFAVTFAAIAERRELPLYGLTIGGTGHLTELNDRRLGFGLVELTARIETAAVDAEAVRAAARLAGEQCLVSRALDVPVHVQVDVATPAVAEAAP